MIRCESVAPVSWTLAAQVLNALSAAHFVQMLLFANTRALCGPQLEGRADRARAQQRAQRC
ncbi:hypothetical protein HDV64DRAFT_259653 [Trichoderma sp. TUCIM 5745]